MINTYDIPVKQPFNWAECLWYLDREFDDCIYRVYADKVRRAFNFDGQNLLVDLVFTGETLRIIWLVGEPNPAAIAYVKNFVSNWFDLESDLSAFYRMLEQKQELAYMPEAFNGLRFVGIPDLFEALVWTITGQQINLQFAYRIKRRLVEMYGSSINFEGTEYWMFPPPEVIAELSIPALRELQLSNKKAEYIINIAQAFVNQTLSKEHLLKLPDFEARQRQLTAIKGIGIWTANYVLMKSMKENSAVPYGDAGLIKALVGYGLITDKHDDAGIRSFYQLFSGWESYMSLYLWRSMAIKKA